MDSGSLVDGPTGPDSSITDLPVRSKRVPKLSNPNPSASSPTVVSPSVIRLLVSCISVQSLPVPVPFLHPPSVRDSLVSRYNSIPEAARLNA